MSKLLDAFTYFIIKHLFPYTDATWASFRATRQYELGYWKVCYMADTDLQKALDEVEHE